MELLIAILMALGFHYTEFQVMAQANTGYDVNVQHAQYIKDAHLYHYDENEVIIIEDGVDPANDE